MSRLNLASRVVLRQPCDKTLGSLMTFGIDRRIAQLVKTETRENRVVHVGRALGTSTMFQMALATTADVGVEGRGLALKQGLVVGVADDALCCFNSFAGCVAGGAIVFKRRVRFGKLARTRQTLPGIGPEETLVSHDCNGNCCHSEQNEDCRRERFHSNQRRPKWIPEHTCSPINT